MPCTPKWLQDMGSAISGTLILIIPGSLMLAFIVWAVITTTVLNQTKVVQLDDLRCLVRTDFTIFNSWLDDDDKNGERVIAASGGSKIILILAKLATEDCGDIFAG